ACGRLAHVVQISPSEAPLGAAHARAQGGTSPTFFTPSRLRDRQLVAAVFRLTEYLSATRLPIRLAIDALRRCRQDRKFGERRHWAVRSASVVVPYDDFCAK